MLAGRTSDNAGFMKTGPWEPRHSWTETEQVRLVKMRKHREKRRDFRQNANRSISANRYELRAVKASFSRSRKSSLIH